MATLTAQILVGSAHPNHDGINPTHYVFLWENDRPAWILVHQNIFKEREENVGRITWIPTIENILEDALLMIAIHVCKNNEVMLYNLFCKFNKGYNSQWNKKTLNGRKENYTL